MDLIGTMPAFVLAVVLISASPGPAMALILRRAALHGFRAAVPTVLGLELGLYLWALAAAGGLAVLVAASETAYLVLRVVGAGVLIYLGIRAFRAAWVERRALSLPEETCPGTADEGAVEAGPRARGTRRPTARRAFAEGLVVQLANPKAAVFMLAFYPQFVPADRPLFATTAALALLQVVLETGLYLALAAGVARAGGWFRTPQVRQRLEAASGAVLVGLGLRVAVSSR
ncbi:MAG TPA: LysE family translocator [Nocardioidaceae bacterium]|nr:LysE family translocator [Nocardioidaceae bacterium]